MTEASFFIFGFLTYFMLNRFIDALCFRAGRESKYDCSKCDLHCAGYVCYKHRNTEIMQAAASEPEDCNTHDSDIPN